MSKEINLTSLYVDLNKFGQNGEYERALKVANKSKNVKHMVCHFLKTLHIVIYFFLLKSHLLFLVIQQAPDEEKAINCKIICLIQLSRFNDGLKTINNTKLQSWVSIHSYLYRNYKIIFRNLQKWLLHLFFKILRVSSNSWKG